MIYTCCPVLSQPYQRFFPTCDISQWGQSLAICLRFLKSHNWQVGPVITVTSVGANRNPKVVVVSTSKGFPPEKVYIYIVFQSSIFFLGAFAVGCKRRVKSSRAKKQETIRQLLTANLVMTPGIQWMHHDESHESHPENPGLKWRDTCLGDFGPFPI